MMLANNLRARQRPGVAEAEVAPPPHLAAACLAWHAFTCHGLLVNPW